MSISECYAYEDGKISYRSTDEGMKVYINDQEYQYNPKALYFLPEGTVVKKFTRICTGILDIRKVINKVNNNYEDAFYFFRKQFNEILQRIPNILNKKISETNDIIIDISDKDKITPELIEFLYILIVKKINGRLVVKNVKESIHEFDSLFTTLSFENARKSFRKITPEEGLPFVSDTLTSIILPLLVNKKLK
jgi:hypothetical protein